jgi:2'-5' RNA ligase
MANSNPTCGSATPDLYAAQYDQLWQRAAAAFAAQTLSVDPHLAAKDQDRRRGATLLIRPASAVAQRIASVLDELRLIEPRQYFYRPDELHVTLLSLFTGTENPQPYLAQLDTYRRAIDPVLAAASAFPIDFCGFTASPAALMVQGFPAAAAAGQASVDPLNALRDALRAAIDAVGLGANLDRRYRISTCHMTAMRFAQEPTDIRRLAGKVESLRKYEFGQSPAAEVHLVENDWYMSHDRVRILHTYRLA